MGDSSFFKNAATTYTTGQGSITTSPNPTPAGPARSSFFEGAGTAYTPTASSGTVVSFNGRGGAVVPLAGDYSFSLLSATPTTLAGYGITDALVKTWNGRSGTVAPAANDYTFAQLASIPTTLAGYGITDALKKTNNLSDVGTPSTALANLAGAPLASPTLTGTPVAPTATLGTNTTQIATTAFVLANAAAGSTFATEAQAEAGTSTAVVMSPSAVSQAINTNALGFKNVAGRNGGFEVWQLGTSVAVPASTVSYTADGWYVLTGANEATTISRQTGNTNGSSYACRVQRNSGQTGTATYVFGFPLDVDELKKMAGQSVLLQFNVSTGANWSPTSGTLLVALFTGTGAPVKQYAGSYAGSVTAISGSTNLAQSAAATTIFSNIAAITSNIGQAEIQFQWTPVGTAGANDWFQVDDVDLRVVPAGLSGAKPAFERSDFVWDLQRCQRHMAMSYDYGTALGSATLNGIEGGINFTRTGVPANISFPVHISFPGTMRATPTISYWDHAGNASKFSDGSNNAFVANTGAVTVQLITAKSFQAYQSIGFSTYLHYQADARI